MDYDDDAYEASSYRPSRYATLFGRVYHHNAQRFSTEGNYWGSIASIVLAVGALGGALFLAVSCFLGLARFARCRRRHASCFRRPEVKKRVCSERRTRVALVFALGAACAAACAGPRASLRRAARDFSRLADDLAATVDAVDGELADVRGEQLPVYDVAGGDLGCATASADATLAAGVAAFVVSAEHAVADAQTYVDGLANALADAARVADDAKSYVTLGFGAATAAYWAAAALCVAALYADRRRLDGGGHAFAALLFVAGAAAIALALGGATAVADFCAGDTAAVAVVAERLGAEPARFAAFYETCRGANPVRNATAPVWRGLAALEGALDLADGCGGEGVDVLRDEIRVTRASLRDVDGRVGCAALHPAYAGFVYDAACGDLLDGLAEFVFLAAAAVLCLGLGLALFPCANYTHGDAVVEPAANRASGPVRIAKASGAGWVIREHVVISAKAPTLTPVEEIRGPARVYVDEVKDG